MSLKRLINTPVIQLASFVLPACAILVGFSLANTTPTSAATSASIPMNIYFGTTHMHTGADNDHGGDNSKAGDIFSTAKSNGFNFVFLTEHSGPSGPISGDAYYADAINKAAAYTENGKFVGLAGYEYSENGGDGDNDSGHMTGYGTDDFVDASKPGMKFLTFMDYLVSQSASRTVLGGFNHPDATGHPASASSLLNYERKKRIVMSEAQRNAGYDAAKDDAYYKGTVKALDRGWWVAPTCGLDGHGLYAVQLKESSSKKPCRTGVLVPKLTKYDLLTAFKERRIYTTRDTNMRIKVSANGYWMGSEFKKPSKATFNISISDPDTSNSADKIKKVQIIGNGGKVLASKSFSAHSVNWKPSVSTGTNKYMFVRVFNGERSAHTAVAAPVWFK